MSENRSRSHSTPSICWLVHPQHTRGTYVTVKYVQQENWSRLNKAPRKICADINFTRNICPRKNFPKYICPPKLIFLGTFVHWLKFTSDIRTHFYQDTFITYICIEDIFSRFEWIWWDQRFRPHSGLVCKIWFTSIIQHISPHFVQQIKKMNFVLVTFKDRFSYLWQFFLDIIAINGFKYDFFLFYDIFVTS